MAPNCSANQVSLAPDFQEFTVQSPHQTLTPARPNVRPNKFAAQAPSAVEHKVEEPLPRLSKHGSARSFVPLRMTTLKMTYAFHGSFDIQQTVSYQWNSSL